MLGKLWSITWRLALLAGCVFGGWALLQLGFDQLQAMRQLERVPRTQILAVLPGEVNLEGQVRLLKGQVLSGFLTKKPCAYYRYLEEHLEEDSEGDKSWVTKKDFFEVVPFGLDDESATLRIDPTTATNDVSFSVHLDHTVTEGDWRYSEYRLDENDTTFVFGYAVKEDQSHKVVFDKQGAYTPIVSQDGELGERRGMALGSIFACWGGLVCASFAVVLLCALFKVHQMLVYLVLVSCVLGLGTFSCGLLMLEQDLTMAIERIDRVRTVAETDLRTTFSSYDVPWDGEWNSLGDFGADHYRALRPGQRERARQIRIDLARSIERTNGARAQFPEWLLAPLWGIDEEPRIALPDADQRQAKGLEQQLQEATINGWVGGIVGPLAALFAFFLSWWGIKQLKHKRFIENIPTSKVSGAAYGLVELKGKVVVPKETEPLSSTLTSTACVYFTYEVEEKRRSGKKTRWVTIESTTEDMRFLCQDATGTIAVAPDDAEVITHHKSVKRSGSRRYTETRLEVGDPLYALGYAEIEPDNHTALVVRRGPSEFPYLLSNLSERALMVRKAALGLLGLNLGLCGSILAGLLAFGLLGAFAPTDYLLSAMIAPTYLSGIYLLILYNDLVFLRLRVSKGWSNIDVALKKRFDLLPNLERVAKQYFAHERKLQTTITELRGRYKGGVVLNPLAINRLVSDHGALTDLFLGLEENYPELRGNEVVADLRRKLVEVENDVALMREGYNQAVERYNTRMEQVPELFIARAGNFESAQHLQASLAVREVPKVAELLEEGESAEASAAPADEHGATPPELSPNQADEAPQAKPGLTAADEPRDSKPNSGSR